MLPTARAQVDRLAEAHDDIASALAAALAGQP
jgi:hypothetical protein